MSGAIPPLPQYSFMAWCLVKAQGQLYLHPVGVGSIHRRASTYTEQHNTEKRRHTAMLVAGFEVPTPVLEWSYVICVVDCAATGTGR
jgi:hypothetical protein